MKHLYTKLFCSSQDLSETTELGEAVAHGENGRREGGRGEGDGGVISPIPAPSYDGWSCLPSWMLRMMSSTVAASPWEKTEARLPATLGQLVPYPCRTSFCPRFGNVFSCGGSIGRAERQRTGLSRRGTPLSRRTTRAGRAWITWRGCCVPRKCTPADTSGEMRWWPVSSTAAIGFGRRGWGRSPLRTSRAECQVATVVEGPTYMRDV